MKKFLILTVFFLIHSLAFSQPWRLKEHFRIAFLDTYDDYICRCTAKGDKIYVEGFEKKDSLIKVFDYEASKPLKKNGYFNQYDKQGKLLFNIFFEEGIAKKLDIKFTDGTLGRYKLENDLLNGQYIMYQSNGKIKEYGRYKNNAPIGEWTYYNINGKVITEANYCGGSRRLTYNVQAKKLITQNEYLDTIKSEIFTELKFDSLKKALHHTGALLFPIDLACKTGVWKFYDDKGTLIKEKDYSSEVWEERESY